MRIEKYFQELRHIIDQCASVQSFSITHDKRGSHQGYIRGEIYFRDDSILHLREFVDVEFIIERLMYVYQYVDSSESLIFRYDNTGHHKKLNLPSYPHHKHVGHEGQVIASSTPDLADILAEIEALLPLSDS